jgi:hypothetical protein
MPDQSTFKVEAVDWSDIGYQLMAGFAKLAGEVKAGDGLVSTLAKKEGAVAALALELMVDIAVRAGEGLHKLEEPFFPIIAGFVAPIVAGLFGAEVDASTFSHRLAHGDAHETARRIVDKFLQAIEGDGAGELAPGPDGGARVASAAVAASLESTFNAIVPELLSDLLPLDLGHFKELTELPEGIIRALGVGRLVRRAVGPLVTVCAATPMEWHVHKKYRPTLLSASSCARRSSGITATRRNGTRSSGGKGTTRRASRRSLTSNVKTFSVADVRTFYAREEWDGVRAERYLRDQGYDAEAAHDALRLEGLRRFEQLEGQEASALITAYAARDIDRPTFDAALEAHVAVASERALHSELAELRRALNVKRLSSAQVERMVKSGVLAFVDYREAVRREGYPEEDVTALELQLRCGGRRGALGRGASRRARRGARRGEASARRRAAARAPPSTPTARSRSEARRPTSSAPSCAE